MEPLSSVLPPLCSSISPNLVSVQSGLLSVSTASELKTALHDSVDSRAKVVMDNRLALDYLLAKQGRICAMTKTSAALTLIIAMGS